MKSVPVDNFSASQLTDCALRAPLMHPLPVDRLCLGPSICQLGLLQGFKRLPEKNEKRRGTVKMMSRDRERDREREREKINENRERSTENN